MYVLVPHNWVVHIEVFDVGGHEVGAGGGYHAVEEQFGCHHIGGGGTDGPCIVHEVSSCGETDIVHLLILRLGLGSEPGVAKLAFCRKVGPIDKVDCVGSTETIGIATLG